jgi:hypothetical protein
MSKSRAGRLQADDGRHGFLQCSNRIAAFVVEDCHAGRESAEDKDLLLPDDIRRVGRILGDTVASVCETDRRLRALLL